MYAQFVAYGNANPGSGTHYMPLDGFGAFSTTENAVSQVMPHDTTIDKLHVTLRTAPGGATSWAVTLMVDGVASALTTTITGAGLSNKDDTHSVSVLQGQTVSLRWVASGATAAPGGFSITSRQNASGKFAVLFGIAATQITASTFFSPAGGSADNQGTESNAYAPIPFGGTIQNLFVKSDVDPATTATWTVTMRANSADLGSPAISAVVTHGQAPNGAGFIVSSDVTHTGAVVAADLLAVHVVAANSPASSRISGGFTVVPTTDGDACWLNSVSTTASTSATNYEQLHGGYPNALLTTEAQIYPQIAVQVCTIKSFYVKQTVNSGAGGSGKQYVHTVRDNAADTAAVVTILNAVSTGSITGLGIAIAEDDLLDISIVPSNTPSAARVQTGIHYTMSSVPANTVAPAVTGTPTKGKVLTTDNGTWTGTPTSYAYQWQRDTAGNGTFANIGGATSSTYTLVSGDIGNKVRCVVTATNAAGSTAANSNQVGLIGQLYSHSQSMGAEWCDTFVDTYHPGGVVLSPFPLSYLGVLNMFDGFKDSLAVTPSNSTDLTWSTRALFVGGGGDVKIDPAGGGAAVTLSAVPAGSILPIQAKRVYATGTTATLIIALR